MNDFKTVAFFRKVELFFNHPCETVNPFFDPKWRNLLYPWWQPEILTPPVGPGLAGLVQRVIPPSLNAGKGIILSVHDHKHNSQDWQIYYSVIWGDYELQQIQINCSPNTSGGTDAVWTEKIAGFGSHGVKPVSEFVKTKTLESRVNTYRNAIDAHIAGKDPGKFNSHLKMYDNGVIPEN
jgi:hypothetical protein